jgi:hypothetical protein
MDKTLLEQWLCGAEAIPPAPLAIAFALGLPIDEVADTTLLRTVPRVRSLRFVLAVLQDLFPADIDVQIWLDAPRSELRGASARQALIAGQVPLIEQLVVTAWNTRSGQMSATRFVHSMHKTCDARAKFIGVMG